MAGTAKQVDFLLGNMFGNSSSEDFDGKLLAAGTVEFRNPGLTTKKTIWDDKDKAVEATNPVVLDSYGNAEVFADGFYDLVVKDSDGNSINTPDSLHFSTSTSPVFAVNSISAGITTSTTGQIIYADTTTGGDFTITLQTAASIGGESFVFVNTGTGVLTIDGNGSETIGGETTITLSNKDEAAQIWSDGTNWKSLNVEYATGSPPVQASAHSMGIIF